MSSLTLCDDMYRDNGLKFDVVTYNKNFYLTKTKKGL